MSRGEGVTWDSASSVTRATVGTLQQKWCFVEIAVEGVGMKIFLCSAVDGGSHARY